MCQPKSDVPFSATDSHESSALTASAPTTAPNRLVAPPTTSIASVMNVRSRYTEFDLHGQQVHVEAAGEAGEERRRP